MVGDINSEKQMGVIPRSLNYLYNLKQNQEKGNGNYFTIDISFIQIYLENISDLLNPSNT